MKRMIMIAAVLALACGGAGFAVGAATFARADDHTTRTDVVRTVLASDRAASDTASRQRTPSATAPVSAPAPTTIAPAPVVIAPAPTPGIAEVRVRRLVVTRGIEAREPIDSIDELDVAEELDRVYAFVELANDGDGDGTVTVTFEREGGPTTGVVDLEAPARAGRWRTWAFTRGIDREGAWSAVVRDDGGRVLARHDFDVR
ncbi:MAG: DUF2914 domain-containing protein [Myxococcota bacterium]|nr:DUF2914 domain-containing protein [Myxococcota bacterium]